MAALTHVFTLARVAEMLGEDQDWLNDISDELEPEDGLIIVYGTGEEYTIALTELGIENLKQIIQIHRDDASRTKARSQ
jgi:predicted flap endonuclease-1-like 5' DNA nuclease